jgi:UDP-glucuronate 4-epimerase
LRILLTGAAGFIGSNLFRALIQRGHEVTAIDSLRPSYGGNLASKRIQEFNKQKFYKLDLSAMSGPDLANEVGFHDVVIHLAAYPGVRNGERNKDKYFANNIQATHNIFEYATITAPQIVFYASSSSVYGDQGAKGPCAEESNSISDLKSFYSTTKYINEVQAANFSRSTEIPSLGLRFFTVYGNFGRPDMAYANFARKLLKGEKLSIFGGLDSVRDYTFIDDAIEQIVRILLQVENFSGTRLETCLQRNDNSMVLNLGLNNPVTLRDFISTISEVLEIPLKLEIVDAPKEDSKGTCSSVDQLNSLIEIGKSTPLRDGMQQTLNKNSMDWIFDFDA